MTHFRVAAVCAVSLLGAACGEAPEERGTLVVDETTTVVVADDGAIVPGARAARPEADAPATDAHRHDIADGAAAAPAHVGEACSTPGRASQPVVLAWLDVDDDDELAADHLVLVATNHLDAPVTITPVSVFGTAVARRERALAPLELDAGETVEVTVPLESFADSPNGLVDGAGYARVRAQVAVWRDGARSPLGAAHAPTVRYREDRRGDFEVFGQRAYRRSLSTHALAAGLEPGVELEEVVVGRDPTEEDR